MKRVSVVLVFVLAIMMLGSCTAKAKDSGQAANSGEARKTKRSDLVVGVSWKTFQEERWVREFNVIKEYCESQGIKLIYQVSENDGQRQSAQIENLASQGVDILVVVSSELEIITNALKDAAAEGVLVCYYEQVDGETYFDLSGGNNQFEIGQAITRTIGNMGITGNVAYLLGDATGGTANKQFYEGMKDSMKNCNVNVVGEQWVTNWDPAIGMAHVENWIAQYGDSLTAILCMNDGLAGGAVQALTNAGLAGKVLTCGQDCDLLAVQRIVAGTQVSTVLKSGVEYPRLFVETCIKYYLGEITDADFEHTAYNDQGEIKPFLLYPGTVVTKDNIDEVIIAAGVYTREQVYGEQ
jgi:D-xylose transport system substrate-binding protein